MDCHQAICQTNFVLGLLSIIDRQDSGTPLIFHLVELLLASAPFTIVVCTIVHRFTIVCRYEQFEKTGSIIRETVIRKQFSRHYST